MAVGEGEPIVNEIASGLPLTGIRGLAFLCDGRIVKTKSREPIADLDGLPWPVRDRFPSFRKEEPLGIYNHIDCDNQNDPAYMITTRGCNHCCTICRSSREPPLRARSVSNVIAEIEDIAFQGVRFIIFLDSNFLYDQTRVEAFSACLGRLGIQWMCQARPEYMTDQICRTMVNSGCILVGVGVESINPELRRLYGKGGTIEVIRKGLTVAKRAGLLVKAYIILGPLPGLRYIDEEIDFLIDTGVDIVTFQPLFYGPGTALWESACEDGRIQDQWTDRCLPMTEVDNTVSEKDVQVVMRTYYHRFYYRPIFILRQAFRFLVLRKSPVRRITIQIILTACIVIAKGVVYQTVEFIRRLLALSLRKENSLRRL